MWMHLLLALSWLKDFIEPLIDPILYLVPLMLVLTSLHYPEGGARSQIAILAAGFALVAFFIRTRLAARIFRRYNVYTVTFLWCWSFLTPMAIITYSSFLGFFSVGSIFGACGFVAFPMPFWWAAGFQDKMSVDRCMVVSIVIICMSLGARVGVYQVSNEVMSTFQTGCAVFGMLSFGLAGFIKSARMSGGDICGGLFYFCSATHPLSFIYPLAWLVLAYLGSIFSYPSLTNTSITFVALWMSQFIWRLVGTTSLSVFLASCVLFWTTLWLKTNSEFLVSLFKV